MGRRALFSHVRAPRLSAGVVASSVDPGAGLSTEGRERRKRNMRRRAGIEKKARGLFAAFLGGKGGGASETSSSGNEGEIEREEEEEDDNRRWLGFGAEQTLAD